MRYLVTGGAGFIGSNLANVLVRKGHQVTVVDDLSMGNRNNLNCQVDFFENSITNYDFMEKLISNREFDYIFHLAAIASVADSIERPEFTYKVNNEATLKLLSLVRKYQKKLKRFVFSSSAAVYGDEPTLPKSELSVIKPMSPYAIDKFSSEKYTLVFSHLYGVPTSAVRFFNVFGPNQNPCSPYSGVISILVSKYQESLKNKRAEFTVFGDGQQERDFIYVEDVIVALLKVSEESTSLGEVYNIGTGKGTTLNTLIECISKILNKKINIKYSDARAGDIKKSIADITKIKSIGFTPQYTIVEGLKKYLEFVNKESSL